MRNPAALRWMVGAILVSLVIGALAFFVIISPTLDATAEARERAESEQARIDQLEIQLAGLKADFARIDEFRAELAEIRVGMPSEVLLNELTRQVDSHATQTEVVIADVSFSTPFEVLAPRSAAPPPPAPEEGESEDEDGGDAAPATPEPTGPTLPEGFYAVPVQLLTVGTYEDTLDFIDRLQFGNERFLFVNGLQTSVLEQSGAEGGRPAVEDGDLETTISFVAWVLLNTDGEIVDPEDADVVVPELPSGNGNPFAPLQ